MDIKFCVQEVRNKQVLQIHTLYSVPSRRYTACAQENVYIAYNSLADTKRGALPIARS